MAVLVFCASVVMMLIVINDNQSIAFPISRVARNADPAGFFEDWMQSLNNKTKTDDGIDATASEMAGTKVL